MEPAAAQPQEAEANNDANNSHQDAAENLDEQFRVHMNAVVEELETEDLPTRMGQDDPHRMRLTREERDFALEIQDAIELIPDVENLSDYWYAQFALICKDDGLSAVERAEGLAAFREQYSILDSTEQGCRALEVISEWFPLFFLDLSFSGEQGSYVCALDGGNVSLGIINTPERVDQYLVGMYYLFNAFCPDMESIRKGITCLIECGNMGHTTRHDFKLHRRGFAEMAAHYPITGAFKHYNCGVMFNIMGAIVKRILPKDYAQRYQFGLTFDGGLDAYFMVPDAEATTQRVLSKLQDNLRRRYQNEKEFSLDEACN